MEGTPGMWTVQDVNPSITTSRSKTSLDGTMTTSFPSGLVIRKLVASPAGPAVDFDGVMVAVSLLTGAAEAGLADFLP